MITEQRIKRGGFARDRRTGQIVRVKEQGGSHWLVHPAYKSDGYWTETENLDVATNPHRYSGWHLLLMLGSLGIAVGTGWGLYQDLAGAAEQGSRWIATVAVGGGVFAAMSRLLGLIRD